MMSKSEKAMWFVGIVAIASMLALSGCGNTISGVGKDIQKIGDNLQKPKVDKVIKKPLTKKEISWRNNIGEFDNLFYTVNASG